MIDVNVSTGIDVNKKIEQIKKDGVDKLHIVTDFDATLTFAYNEDGSRAPNTWSIFRNKGYLGKNYLKESTQLYEYYHFRYEINENISEDVRIKKLEEWWNKHFDLLKKYSLTKEMLEKISETKELILRPGVDDFMNLVSKYKVPLLVFSAGIGDLIKNIFKVEHQSLEFVKIISNFCKYDKNNKVIGPSGKIIHVLNKGEIALNEDKYIQELKLRKNIVLIGDSLGDLDMVKDIEYDNLLTIGLFTQSDNEELKRKYNDAFDLVIEGDGSFKKVNEIIESIVKSSF